MNAGGIFEFAPRAYLGSLGRNCNASLALSCVFSSLALHSSSAAGGHVHEFEGDLREVRRPAAGHSYFCASFRVVSLLGVFPLTSPAVTALSPSPQGENLFELHLHSAELARTALGADLDPSTFLSVDFFEHETQATSIFAGTEPMYDLTLQFVVRTDAFFLEYLDTSLLRIEVRG